MTEWVYVTKPDAVEPPLAIVTRGAYESTWSKAGFVLCDAQGEPIEDPEELKGKALDEALRAADLPVSGTADEKREALSAHVGATPTE